MERFVPYLGILAAFAFAVVLASFSGGSATVQNPITVQPTASSTLSVLPTLVLPSLSLPNISPEETVVASTSAPKKTESKKSTPAVASVSTPSIAATLPLVVPQEQPASTDVGLDAASTLLRGALVNIICYSPIGSGLHSTSGSGIVIDPKGIILTNAHVAQYFLFPDRGVSCFIRTGNPARSQYKASLIYLSPLWVAANASLITSDQPSGTGQYDFALLAITRTTTVTPLPASFSSIPLATNPVFSATPVVIASYAAQFLESAQIQNDLFPTFVFGSVKRVLTFTNNTIDVLELGGSAAAQEGSSGGGIADASGKLVGTIMTSTIEGDTSTRTLRALSAAYIRAQYASETGNAIEFLLAQPTSRSISDFAPQATALEKLLVAEIN